MSNSEDLNFVNILHSQKNAKIDQKVLVLFFAIFVFFFGAFIWAYFSQIDELTRGEGKVIPSEKIKTIQSLESYDWGVVIVGQNDVIGLDNEGNTIYQKSYKEPEFPVPE